jgi:predicted Mrr-cat superfamily restriction endonuclease
MEAIASQIKDFLGTLGFDSRKLDVVVSYSRDDRGIIIGKVVAIGPFTE